MIGAAAAGGQGQPWWLLLPVLVFMAAVGVISIWRLRKGGPGPAVNWVPKSLRASLNRKYSNQGWQPPFDADGDRNPRRTQL